MKFLDEEGNKALNKALEGKTDAEMFQIKGILELESSLIKDEIEKKVNDYASLMMEERGDESMSELDTAKLLNQFKSELLQEYRDSLKNSDSNDLNTQKQAMIKVLLDENVKETSSLETLLATKTGTASTGKTKATGKRNRINSFL